MRAKPKTATGGYHSMDMKDNRQRQGWSGAEDELLFKRAEALRAEGRPLKAVFEAVARETGRKPNSIRNYYYSRIREDGSKAALIGENAAFVPFTPEEVHALLREVLISLSAGISVRACTLRLGGGDNKAMLRYQNKYRSVIKNDRELVKRVVAELKSEGIQARDPYESSRERRRTKSERSAGNLIDVVSGVVNDLGKVDGLDVTAFFESLGALALSAGRGAAALARLDAADSAGGAELASLHEQCSALRSENRKRQNELVEERERYSTLLSLCRRLMELNREFLSMTGVTKMSSLSSYIRELSRSVEDCERLMP